jgi:hypothetical protein
MPYPPATSFSDPEASTRRLTNARSSSLRWSIHRLVNCAVTIQLIKVHFNYTHIKTQVTFYFIGRGDGARLRESPGRRSSFLIAGPGGLPSG